MTAAARSYHHGDLRNALIIAAAELIEESGSLNFAMADAARRAGVSTAAPYRHFKDKDALLEAVAQLGFYGLGASAQAALEKHPRGSTESIIALGNAYVSYVIEKSAFYDLMWGDLGVRAVDSEQFGKNASGFFVLVEALRAYLRSEGLRDMAAQENAVKLWALVHGLASIAMSGKLPLFHPSADVPALLESATRTFLRGLAAEARSSG